MPPIPTNLTIVTEFILMGCSTNKNICIFHLVLFFFIYFCALMDNILIIMTTTLDQNLHTPMYFFVKNLYFGDLCLISVTIPKSIANSFSHSNSISLTGCVAQVFMLVFSATTELHLLTAMCFDHYAAICHPLHYEIIMKKDMCVQLTAISWLGGSLIALMHTVGTFSLSYCGSNIIHQFFFFFCDIPQLLAISCSENLMKEIVPILISVVLDICCFIYIIISFVNIFSTVKKIPSTEGQSKAYCTCLPHLVVVLFLFTDIFAYLKPTSRIPSISDLLISIFYTMGPPTSNPIIYSLRNNAMKMSLQRTVLG
ncbi:LOW QUALITY PROTEIN: olfactory receptor 14A16-like [Lontra canadensis]|uniref:LOW QUALITY PROTEIN: olfactory receptor 14A16-like n=1 Tax=Lontra canadensis TaxID=76717 RepID=UPI0013F33764|nr:LOW QUALITY PROTEIN: olfactory receptor 14A16-like [Lontra canadensis]